MAENGKGSVPPIWPIVWVRVFCYFHPNKKNFKFPEDSQTPVIMVGLGTGIAPFRAFIEERKATGALGKNWLFFGIGPPRLIISMGRNGSSTAKMDYYGPRPGVVPRPVRKGICAAQDAG